MNGLQAFSNPMFGSVRTVTVDGEPWLVGKDVAESLGYSNTKDAISRHVDADDKRGSRIPTPSGGAQEMIIINESGLYSLVMSSKLKTAKAFKRWVTGEVLPTIRKHGAYMTPETLEAAILNPDTMIQLCQQLKNEQERRKALEAEREQNRPKVLFAEAVGTSENTILVGELAKLLRQNGVDIGEKRLFKYLRDNGYLIKRHGEDWNMPTQRSVDAGWMRIKETTVLSSGVITVRKTPRITGAGQRYFFRLFLNN